MHHIHDIIIANIEKAVTARNQHRDPGLSLIVSRDMGHERKYQVMMGLRTTFTIEVHFEITKAQITLRGADYRLLDDILDEWVEDGTLERTKTHSSGDHAYKCKDLNYTDGERIQELIRAIAKLCDISYEFFK